MFTVVRSDVLELGAAVPARQAGEIHVGQRVHFAAGGRDLDGRVARISPTIDPTNRSITVYVQVPNGAGALKGNSFATGRIVSRTVDGAIVIPTRRSVRPRATTSRSSIASTPSDALERAPVSVGIVDESPGDRRDHRRPQRRRPHHRRQRRHARRRHEGDDRRRR